MSNCLGQKIPNIGETWTGELTSNEKLYALPPLGFQDKITFEVDKVKFDGAVRKGLVVFISTVDPGFAIDGKKYIGMALSSFANKKDIVTAEGWGSYLKIPGGWYAGFGDKNLRDSSTVRFLFKY